MNLQEGQSNPPNTTAIKTPDPTPNAELRLVSPDDLKNFTYTGLNITIPVPLVKVSSEALFGINIDGFIPNLRGKTTNSLFRNLFPVQPSVYSHTIPGFKIQWEASSLPQLMNYFSYRMIEGDVGVCLRIISNTSQTGQLLISQVSGVSRYYYGETEKWTGLRFLQDSMSPIDYAVNASLAVDLSLNRNIAITACRRDNCVKTDLAKKLLEVGRVADEKDESYYPVANQFLEDWLIVAPLTTITHPEASSITIAIYYDWSKVKFQVPMLCVPFLNTDSLVLQILQFIESFKDEEFFSDLTEWKWWPRDIAESKDMAHLKHFAITNSPISYNQTKANIIGTIQRAKASKVKLQG